MNLNVRLNELFRMASSKYQNYKVYSTSIHFPIYYNLIGLKNHNETHEFDTNCVFLHSTIRKNSNPFNRSKLWAIIADPNNSFSKVREEVWQVLATNR